MPPRPTLTHTHTNQPSTTGSMERTNRLGVTDQSAQIFNCCLPRLLANTKRYWISNRAREKRAVNGSALKRQLSVSLGFSLGFYDVDSLVVAIFLPTPHRIVLLLACVCCTFPFSPPSPSSPSHFYAYVTGYVMYETAITQSLCVAPSDGTVRAIVHVRRKIVGRPSFLFSFFFVFFFYK